MGNTRQALLAQHSRSRLNDQMYILHRELDCLKDRINFAQGQEEAMELKKEANEVMGKICRIEDNIDAEDDLIWSNLSILAITALPTTPTTVNSLTHPTSILTTPQYPIQSKQNSLSTPKLTQTDTSAPATPGTPTPQTRRKVSAANGKGAQKPKRQPRCSPAQGKTIWHWNWRGQEWSSGE